MQEKPKKNKKCEVDFTSTSHFVVLPGLEPGFTA